MPKDVIEYLIEKKRGIVIAYFIRVIIYSLVVLLVFWSIGLTSEFTLFTIIFSSIAFGYGFNRLQVNNK